MRLTDPHGKPWMRTPAKWATRASSACSLRIGSAGIFSIEACRLLPDYSKNPISAETRRLPDGFH
jgi:hypothetical protein